VDAVLACRSVDEVVETFRVSRPAAEIRWDELKKKA